MDVAVGIDLLQAAQLCLSGNQLTLQRCSGFDHCLTLSRNVDSSVLTGKITKVLCGCVKIAFYFFEPLLKENTLSPGRGSAQLCHKPVKFRYISISHCSGAFRIVIPNCYRDNAALAIFGDIRVLREIRSGVFDFRVMVYRFKPEFVDDAILDGLTAKDTYEQCTGTFHS